MKKNFLTRALLLAVAMGVSSTHAAVDYFLSLYNREGTILKGESLDKTFPGSSGWFQIAEFAISQENPSTIGSATGGAGGGKIKFKEFTIAKNVDILSPALFKAMASGDHFKYARLAMRKSGADGSAATVVFLQFEFNLVFINNIDWTGSSGDDAPTERVTFAYGAFKITYRSQKPDGSLNTPTSAFWDQVTNTQDFDNLPQL